MNKNLLAATMATMMACGCTPSTNSNPLLQTFDTPYGIPPFEKIEDATIDAQIQRLENIKKQNEIDGFEPAPVAENIDFEQFMKLDIRVGKVLECAKVPKADKLLQFKIDDGMGGRTIVSGIAKHYNPEDLVGKEVCFVANLAPRKLKGIESQGMILSAEDAGGRLVVIGPNGEVKPGAQVK